MRSTIVLTLILLVAAFAVAQAPTSPSAPAGQSQTHQMQKPTDPGMPSGQAPSANSPSAAAPMGGTDMVEGCLGGTNPNFTVTDKAGTTYQIVVPQGADASVLAKHIGESIQVQGSLDNPGSASSAAGSAAGAHAIRASRIGRGSTTCPGSASTPKPPSK